MKKFILASSGIISGLLVGLVAHAQTAIVVPTSTTASLAATAGAQMADVGTLAVIVLAAGIPLGFYILGQLISFVPKHKGGKK